MQRYIAQQVEHHRKFGFQEEFRRILVRNHKKALDDLLEAHYGRVLDPDEDAEYDCQKAIAKGARKFTKSVMRALHSCRNDIANNELAITPQQCLSEPNTVQRLASAGSDLRESVAEDCTDAVVASLNPCAATGDELVNPSGDDGCLITTHRTAIDALLSAEYGR